MNTEPHQRLRDARIASGFRSAAAAARAHGWQESAYRHHENGTRSISLEAAIAYGRAFNVNAAWLIGFDEERTRPSDNEAAARLRIPKLPSNLSDPGNDINRRTDIHLIPEVTLGSRFLIKDSSYAEHAQICHGLSKTLLRELLPEARWPWLVFARMPDASMSPTIARGTLMLIDAADCEINQQDLIWAVRDSEVVMIRRVRRESDSLTLTADSEPIQPFQKPSWLLPAIGRVIWAGSPL